jgi:hypothetical protein
MTASACPHCGAERDDSSVGDLISFSCGTVFDTDECVTFQRSDDCYERQIAAQAAKIEILRSALTDMLSCWHYIRQTHGDLCGVVWDIYQNNATSALKEVK